MEYLIKSTVIISVMFLFYKVLLERLTFFNLNRVFFLVGIVIAVIIPLDIISFDLTQTEVTSVFHYKPSQYLGEIVQMTQVSSLSTFSFGMIMKITYFIGVIFFAIHFIMGVVSVLFMALKNPKREDGKFVIIQFRQDFTPCSFFHWIFLPKNTSHASEPILEHEKVHASQYHSIDILLAELFLIFQWFNPLVWMYRQGLETNLEYIADREASKLSKNIKSYQYLLLSLFQGKGFSKVTNNFFSSPLKKRIIMLKKSKSNRIQLLKFGLLIPIFGLFLSFQSKEVKSVEAVTRIENNQETKDWNTVVEIIKNGDWDIINPVEKTSSYKLSSKYGKRMHPIEKKMKMHDGIDIISKEGTNIFAVADGQIMTAKYHHLKGNYIEIVHENGYQTNYFHLGSLNVSAGQKVTQSEIIGTVGSSGKSISPHLHFEVMKDGKHKDPQLYLGK